MQNQRHPFLEFSPTTLAECLGISQVMHYSIHPLWSPMPRIAGPAFTVRCKAGDHLMLHAAIYRAPKGSLIVVEAGDDRFAVAGGNVCAVAQKHGVLGFVVDGVVRDLADIRLHQFPVIAKGVSPVPGAKSSVEGLQVPIVCGGVHVNPGDIVVADEEGTVVVPKAEQERVLKLALQKVAKEADLSLDSWEKDHRQRIEQLLQQYSFQELATQEHSSH